MEGGGKYRSIKKPLANILYSAIMDAIDVADRHISDTNINIKTHKWYLNVFCMILSAAVVEMHSCYTEEHGDELDRRTATRRLISELSRAKWTPRGSTETVFPRKKQSAQVLKRQRPPQLYTPQTSKPKHVTTTGHKRDWCGVCLKKGKKKTTRCSKRKRALKTTRYCNDCKMYICTACENSRPSPVPSHNGAVALYKRSTPNKRQRVSNQGHIIVGSSSESSSESSS